MPITRSLKRTGNTGTSHHLINEGIDLCCGDDVDNLTYRTANLTLGSTTVDNVSVTVPGGSPQTINLDGSALDWTLAANDAELKRRLEKAATDLGFQVFGNCFTFARSAAGRLQITIADSTLIWNWIGTTSTGENAFSVV